MGLKNRLKDASLILVSDILAITGTFALCYGIFEGKLDNEYYAETGIVTQVSTTSDLVVFQTQNGNLFSFYGADDYEVNDMVSVIMDSNGTDEVKDDRVINAKYSGYLTNEQVKEWIK